MSRTASRNSLRRLRFASVSRSWAWSDFFSDATQAAQPKVAPATNSFPHRYRRRSAHAVQPPSDRNWPRPVPPSDRPLPDLHGSSVRGGDGPARPSRFAFFDGKSSRHSRHSLRTPKPVSESSRGLSHAPRKSSDAGHPHKLVPSDVPRGVSPLLHYTIFAISLIVWSRSLMVHTFPISQRRHYGPDTSRERPHDSSSPSSDTA